MARLSPFDMACPIDSRYYGTDPDFFARLKPYVSEEAYLSYQVRVEVALADVLAERGIAPPSLPIEIERAWAELTVADVYREENRIGHVVRALVNCIREKVGEESRPFVHLFATSNDITDTANALRLKELARDVLLPDLIELELELIRMAQLYANTLQIGRTHGKHAEPITFGYALANYVERLGNRIEVIENARKNLRGKFSGAVGAYNATSLVFRDPADFEKQVLAKLVLQPVDRQVSTQIVHPEYATDLTHAVVSAFSVIANLADDIRHLHRSEIAEVQEKYDEARVGSSTMPHKLNPKNFEFVKSMWKELMPRMITVYLDQISEHQRDLTNSASGRFVTELLTGFAYSVDRLTGALTDLDVNERNMLRNFEQSRDEALAEPLYILLSVNGHSDGHSCARRLVAQARESGKRLAELIRQDDEVRPYLARVGEEDVQVLREPEKYVGLAPVRTEMVCEWWNLRCETLRRLLDAEKREEVQRLRQKKRH
ncbi:MAG: lyase family protein [Candidatus Methylomirabilia bacterium]